MPILTPLLFLFEIEDVFSIPGRGCVIVPGIPYSFAGDVRADAHILIETPSGSRLETTIAAFEMINRGKPVEHAPFSLPRTITKEQLPVGSRVYLASELGSMAEKQPVGFNS